MRFLHTSDWHLGRMIRSRSRDAEHEAALQQLLTHAREAEVDCLLVAGDVFDTSAPTPDAERIVYQFFQELHGLGIPAVVIAGNHDHPRRFEAIAPLLRTVNIHSLGDPKPFGEGGDIEVRSRDGRETAVVAALPWVSERRAVDMAALQEGPGAALLNYAEQVAQMIQNLSGAFRTDTVNVLLAHALVNDAVIGPDHSGGERELHMAMGIYGIQRQRFPNTAQYIGLGHVHKAQELVKSPAAWYSGSLMQLDFGETQQDKSVNLIEVHARQPSVVTKLPIDKGTRKLIDIGRAGAGINLNELQTYAATVGDAWLRVFVDLDLPVANLPALVRETLPNAVHVERTKPTSGATEEVSGEAKSTAPEDMFAGFYRTSLGRNTEPTTATMTMFRRLLREESDAASEA
ncbi:MAG: exonuclease SbcCD subunit D [Dehalococcoidia bacterium]